MNHHQRPARSTVKVAMSSGASDRCWPISLERKVPETSKLVSRLRMSRAAIKAYKVGFLHAGGGIPCRPHPADTQLVKISSPSSPSTSNVIFFSNSWTRHLHLIDSEMWWERLICFAVTNRTRQHLLLLIVSYFPITHILHGPSVPSSRPSSTERTYAVCQLNVPSLGWTCDKMGSPLLMCSTRKWWLWCWTYKTYGLIWDAIIFVYYANDWNHRGSNMTQLLIIIRTRGWALDRVHNSRRPLNRLQYVFTLCDHVTLIFDLLT